jgi:hypothetical protein
MATSSSTTSGGVGLTGLLFLVFLTLKLAEVGPVATWSWWWVTAPLWGSLALIVAIVMTVAIVVGLKNAFTPKWKR